MQSDLVDHIVDTYQDMDEVDSEDGDWTGWMGGMVECLRNKEIDFDMVDDVEVLNLVSEFEYLDSFSLIMEICAV